MARGKRHDDQTRAAVMAALLAGQGATEIAREYQLDEATVRNWKRTLSPETLTKVNEQKEHDFGQLVGNYLGSLLTTLQVQADFFRNEEWLAKQKAEAVAVLHGVCADKGIRLFEVAERASAVAGAEEDSVAS